jgi:chorismate mutase
MPVRGVRGAITINSNTKEDIVEKSTELIKTLVKRNNILVEDIASVMFSVTEDIDAEFPAVAARNLGWIYTPLFCTREIPVKGSMKGCIRVIMHVNSDKRQDEIIQAYLGEAEKLRPDLNSNDTGKYYISK